MLALRLLQWKSPAELVEVPKPTPGPGQVVIRIGGAGACHSDLHLMRDFEAGAMPWGPPFTLGHENAGWVDSVGSGVTEVAPGQAVAVYGPWGCGKCPRCRIGFETYCDNPAGAPIPSGGGGLGLDGGMAEYMLVPDARFLLPLPIGLDPVHAAPLMDAGLTPYHAVKRSWPKMGPESFVVVIGVGGLGHLGVQIIKATTSAQIIAVDNRQDALDLAKTSGADYAFKSGPEALTNIKDLTHGHGAEVVLDFVGSAETMEMGMQATRVLGDFTLVGLMGGGVPFSFFSQNYEVSLQTTYWGSSLELSEVLNLGARRLIVPTISKFSLAQAPQVYLDLAAGKIEGRAVIVP